MIMKKELFIALLWVVCITTFAVLASCGTTHGCDAYGQVEHQNNDLVSK
jgi:hypothetical protein